MIEKNAIVPSDSPILDKASDMLGRGGYIDRIKGLVMDNINAPFMLGIYGAAGSGRTSALNMLEEEIRATTAYRVLRFEADEYGLCPDIVFPLIHRIADIIPKEKREAVSDLYVGLADVFLQGSIDDYLGRLSYGTLTVDSLKFYEREYVLKHVNRFGRRLDRMRSAKDMLRELVKRSCDPIGSEQDSRRALLVLIDGLEKCSASKNVFFLRSLRTVFSRSNAIFIAGIQLDDMLDDIRSNVFGGSYESCRSFIEGVFQYGYGLPSVTVNSLRKYVIYLLHEKMVINRDQAGLISDAVSAVCVSTLANNPRKIKKSAVRFYDYLKKRIYYPFSEDIAMFLTGLGDRADPNVMLMIILDEFWPLSEKRRGMHPRYLVSAFRDSAQMDYDEWHSRHEKDCLYCDRDLYLYIKRWRHMYTAFDMDERFFSNMMKILEELKSASS